MHEKAAEAQKLIDSIGPDAAQRVKVDTASEIYKSAMEKLGVILETEALSIQRRKVQERADGEVSERLAQVKDELKRESEKLYPHAAAELAEAAATSRAKVAAAKETESLMQRLTARGAEELKLEIKDLEEKAPVEAEAPVAANEVQRTKGDHTHADDAHYVTAAAHERMQIKGGISESGHRLSGLAEEENFDRGGVEKVSKPFRVEVRKDAKSDEATV